MLGPELENPEEVAIPSCSEVHCSEVSEEVIIGLFGDIESDFGQKFREWVYTINNYTEDDLAAIRSIKSRYHIWAPEVGKEGTPHIQGYIVFTSQRTRKAISKDLKRAWLAPRAKKSKPVYCRDYIRGPYEKNGKKKPFNPEHVETGTIPAQGERNDAIECLDFINQGKRKRDVLDHEDHTHVLRKFPRYVDFACSIAEERRARAEYKARIFPTVHVRWSRESGTGKTTEAEEMDPIRAQITKDHVWFDGYDAHEAILFDEFEGEIPFNQFKQLIDKFPIRLEVKGGNKWRLCRHIWITSNKPPNEWYPWLTAHQQTQLARRLHDVKELNILLL